jgi:mono/diheme cytochrome c family protein
VLGTWLFVALWLVFGLGVFFIAVRGGLGGARATVQGQSYRARRAATTIFVIVYVGFGIVVPLVFLFGNKNHASGQVGGYKLTPAMKQGRELFAQHCGFCHTLAASSSNGKVGPNLDVLKPSQALVLHTIQYGCLQDPPPADTNQTCLGQGTMPAQPLQGQQAQDVAKFVAQVAGRE